MEQGPRAIQLVELEILKVVDRICKENKIPYSLYAGTLLGAVRHQGFIPWDDDLDICMLRGDYELFLQVWENSPPAGFLLQNKETDSDFTQSFSKIRKDHTTFLQPREETYSYHKGIFIDVFPIDRVPVGAFRRRVFQAECMMYQLFTREFQPPMGSELQKVSSSLLLNGTNAKQRARIRGALLNRITRNQNDCSLETIAIETPASIKLLMPANLMDEFVTLSFEGQDFMCMSRWDDYLRLKYGDYMQLPPENERVWKHRPLVVDFTRNIDEI